VIFKYKLIDQKSEKGDTEDIKQKALQAPVCGVRAHRAVGHQTSVARRVRKIVLVPATTT
jgi:hypothetical protein